MRIVYLHQYFRKPSENGSSRTFEIARRMVQRGHDVHVVTSTSESQKRVSETMSGFTVHWLPVPYNNKMNVKERLKAFIHFAFRSAALARGLKGDVVFATSTPLTIVIPGHLARVGRQAPLVFEVRDLWPDVPIAMGALDNTLMRRAALTLERFAYRASAHIVALSPDMAKEIVRKSVPAGKISVVPNAADNAFFGGRSESGHEWRRSLPWLDDRPLVLYCGTLGHVNNVGFLAQVAAEVFRMEPNVRFVVIGTGNEEQLVRDRAQQLGILEKNFHMLPPVPKSEVAKLFSAANISVSTVAPIPILAANSANKVFDSFAASTPVMINHGGWLATLLRESGAGLVVSECDAESAARDLVAFISDEQRLKTSSQAARRLAEQEFDRDVLTNILMDRLEEAAERADIRRRFSRITESLAAMKDHILRRTESGSRVRTDLVPWNKK